MSHGCLSKTFQGCAVFSPCLLNEIGQRYVSSSSAFAHGCSAKCRSIAGSPIYTVVCMLIKLCGIFKVIWLFLVNQVLATTVIITSKQYTDLPKLGLNDIHFIYSYKFIYHIIG